MRFWTASTERMRLTSTGLGIGTSSPASILDISSPAAVLRLASTTGTNAVYQRISNDGGQLYFGIDNSAGNDLAAGSTAHAGVLVAPGTTRNLHFGTNGTVRTTITSAGDVSIGTTSGDIFSNSFARTLNVFSSGVGTTTAINVSGGAASRIQFGIGFTRYGLIYQDDTNFMQIATTTALPISFVTNNAERMRLTAAGNLGIGTSSPQSLLALRTGGTSSVNGGVGLTISHDSNSIANGTDLTFAGITIQRDKSSALADGDSLGGINWGKLIAGELRNSVAAIGALQSGAGESAHLTFYTAASSRAPVERARIDSSGNFIMGRTTVPTWNDSNGFGFAFDRTFKTTFFVQDNSTSYACTYFNATSYTSGTAYFAQFRVNGATVGDITSNGSSTSYVTSSDYRLKNTIAPMTGALAKVALLKPCTYKWNVNGSDGEGFIAHELAEVCPQAVTGEKDAVDADGNIKSQGIDTSFLVATLTAAIQEQQAIIESLKARLDAANL
jgi:hypothetical protein